LVARENIQVLCAYPRRSYVDGPSAVRAEIEAHHTRTLAH
jgi:hypothetical protein